MGFFRDLGKKTESFKRQVEDAASDTHECPGCEKEFAAEYEECPECGYEETDDE
jgi:rRNA maturation endonuclease Nob1